MCKYFIMLWNLVNIGNIYKCLYIVCICYFLIDWKSNMDIYMVYLYVWYMEYVVVFGFLIYSKNINIFFVI